MSDINKRPDAVIPPASQLVTPRSVNASAASQGAKSNDGTANGNDDLAVMLRRGLEETRLPPEMRRQIIAQLPAPEERERLLRELQENGGVPSEQFLLSLGIDVERQP